MSSDNSGGAASTAKRQRSRSASRTSQCSPRTSDCTLSACCADEHPQCRLLAQPAKSGPSTNNAEHSFYSYDQDGYYVSKSCHFPTLQIEGDMPENATDLMCMGYNFAMDLMTKHHLTKRQVDRLAEGMNDCITTLFD